MAKTPTPIPAPSAVQLELERLDVGSKVAIVGHPIHVLLVHFPVAFVIATLGVDVIYWWSGGANYFCQHLDSTAFDD